MIVIYLSKALKMLVKNGGGWVKRPDHQDMLEKLREVRKMYGIQSKTNTSDSK